MLGALFFVSTQLLDKTLVICCLLAAAPRAGDGTVLEIASCDSDEHFG